MIDFWFLSGFISHYFAEPLSLSIISFASLKAFGVSFEFGSYFVVYSVVSIYFNSPASSIINQQQDLPFLPEAGQYSTPV